MRAIDRQRRDDDVDAGSVRQTRVHHGRGFVHVPPNVGDNLVDDMHQVRIVLEPDVGFFQHSRPLDIHLVVSVDQNVIDGGVLQQRLQGTQSEDFIQYFQSKALAFPAAHRGLQVCDQLLDDGQGLCPGALVPHHRYSLQVHFVQKVAMDGGFQLLINLEIKAGWSLLLDHRNRFHRAR